MTNFWPSHRTNCQGLSCSHSKPKQEEAEGLSKAIVSITLRAIHVFAQIIARLRKYQTLELISITTGGTKVKLWEPITKISIQSRFVAPNEVP